MSDPLRPVSSRRPWTVGGVDLLLLRITGAGLLLVTLGIVVISQRHLSVGIGERLFYDVIFTLPAAVMVRRGRRDQRTRAAWWSMAAGVMGYSLATLLST
ncbi:MAG: hypothetical protein KGR42_10700, partial [Acidobacteria bacterium]|nr:hypothetical protein [Acidobacteriota bacterium]